MRELAEIYQQYQNDASWGDKGTVHSYIEPYSELLRPYRTTAKTVLEIGIMGGASLRMWEEYFAGAEVYGVDLCDQPLDMADLRPMIAEGTHRIVLMDAVNPEHVARHFGDKKFDVVIDDASHILAHQLAIYANFKPLMSPTGIYIIEDIEDIDKTRHLFEAIDPERRVRVLDRRSVKERFDDVLVVID